MALTKKEAQERGERLLRRMKGTGWTLRVWENLGWHYEVKTAGLTVFPSGAYHEEKFACLLNVEGKSGGNAFWWEGKRDPGSFSDPNAAVRAEMKNAQKFANSVNYCVAELYRRIPIE